MNEVERAYAAGVVDSDGCITYAKRGPYFYPRVIITNCNLALLKWFKERCGGGSIRPKTRKEGWQQAYAWELATQQAAAFLREVLPYLQVKVIQAELAIELAQRTLRQGGKVPAAEDQEERLKLVGGIRRLNRRGVA